VVALAVQRKQGYVVQTGTHYFDIVKKTTTGFLLKTVALVVSRFDQASWANSVRYSHTSTHVDRTNHHIITGYERQSSS